jgi:Concanavalin A-like lectin/glucanases superfamily
MRLSLVIVCMLGACIARADVYYDFETAATTPVWLGTTQMIQNTSASYQGTNAIAFTGTDPYAYLLTELPQGTTNIEFFFYDDYGPNPPLYRYMFFQLLEATNWPAFAGFSMLDGGWGTTPPETMNHYYAWADQEYSARTMGPIRTIGWHKFTFAIGPESVAMSVDDTPVFQTNMIQIPQYLQLSWGIAGPWGRMDDLYISTETWPPSPCVAPPPGLVGWWPGDGNAIDIAGRNDGTLQGGVGFAPGIVGKAFSLNGVTSYVQVPSSPSLNPTGSFSIETWIYPLQDTGGTQWIVGKWGDTGELANQRSYSFNIISGLALRFSISDMAHQADSSFHEFDTDSGAITLQAWNHVAAVYDQSTGIRSIFVNGVQVTSRTDTPITIYDGVAPLTFGGFVRGGGLIEDFMDGLLDEVSCYNRALSAAEIQAIYNAGSAGKCKPPQLATATATLVDGFVVAATATDSGYGYTNTPQVRFIGGGGSGAKAVAVVSNGVVVGITITDAGIDYTNAPLVVIEPPFIPNPVLSIAPMSFLSFSNLSVGGVYQMQQSVAWYWSNQPVSFTATNALYTQMVAEVAGSGEYRLALSPVPVQAFATPQVVNGFVVGATVTSGGSGYATSPAVTIVGGGGSNATAVAKISGGVVTNITITDAGIGYTNTPTVEIAQPPAAAVSPTVLPVMRLDSTKLSPYDNYQIQFEPVLAGAWSNWDGGLFSPTAVTNSQYLFITNSVGFFRLQYVP